ncbi:hypothetical protein COT95_01885 [Candidatus Falkowbacteria bacterium CG10_big_fil_rev_8_21_14_0_10_37_6]|uniref:Thioredoxin domain-containing protein n=1 Tax=Candidatus Falkowbacteria bacterium CG10_big_fil_rev_8_21_14_0_10_37_6 TaxID=1974563 RepID=A0A2H0V730_9BACT|nr:MAG: hypothetical protein COT95_01885 [Candidatus Falkowbacteria bacterium CG10_big_fil_rev_8_21_14_0_10_37_6]
MKNFKNIFLIFILCLTILILTGAGCAGQNQKKQDVMTTEDDTITNDNKKQNDELINETDQINDTSGIKKDEQKQVDSAMKKDELMINEEKPAGNNQNYSGAVISGKTAKLYDYNQADYEAALKTDNLIVLYFYANWCPICKEEIATALYPVFNELDKDNVIGFRVNYNDNETESSEKELAREFGVAYQHTKVFVKDNQRVLKSPEDWDKDRYISEINKALQ